MPAPTLNEDITRNPAKAARSSHPVTVFEELIIKSVPIKIPSVENTYIILPPKNPNKNIKVDGTIAR